jgi:Peptidase M50B-like
MAVEQEVTCRVCGRPRGENVADGTRCERCLRRQSLQVWLLASAAAGGWALSLGNDLGESLVVVAVTLVVLPPVWIAGVFLHELFHAVAARLLGQTVSRIIVGEGPAWRRLGVDPELVIGRFPIGNGLTYTSDLRRDGYRARTLVVLLVAPLGSLLMGAGLLGLSADWPLVPHTAAVLAAIVNLAMAATTMIPFPTFGGRVRSDLVYALSILRMDDRALAQDRLALAQDRIVAFIRRGESDRAVAEARAVAAAIPELPIARAVPVYALHQSGQLAQAATEAREELGRPGIDEETRTYLRAALASLEGTTLDRLPAIEY